MFEFHWGVFWNSVCFWLAIPKDVWTLGKELNWEKANYDSIFSGTGENSL